MNQVSRPMQIALAAVLVFAVVWFAVLRPKDPAADVAAAPVTPAETAPAANAGGASAETALGSTIESAKNAGAAADAAVKKRETQTGETDQPSADDEPSEDTPAPASTPASTTPEGSATTGESGGAATGETARKSSKNASQERANEVVEAITRDLAARRAVVVLVWSKSGEEDRMMNKRVTKEIDRRKGKVKVYKIPVAEVGRYDGLLGGLALGQIPSTVVIAPNNEAKVLGGLSSTARIDRLTSSATLTKPVATTP